MLRNLIGILRGDSLMDQVDRDIKKMFNLAHTLFNASSKAVIEGTPVEFDLYAKDREINLSVINSRKKIVEHLSVSEVKYPVGELVCITLINNIERIGDYSKNLMDLYKAMGGPIEDTPYRQTVKDLRDHIETFFDKTAEAIFNDNEKMAREVMEGHLHTVKVHNQSIDRLLDDESISNRQSVALSIILRSLKRVSAHLKTVSSSAVNPFMLMGYQQMPKVQEDEMAEKNETPPRSQAN